MTFLDNLGESKEVTNRVLYIDILEQEHIDSFFKDGTLKLSLFQSNRKFENDIRQDENEGFHSYRIVNRNRTNGSELKSADLDVRRLICCSTKLNLDFFLPYFKVDGCFEITNTFGFGYEIAKVLKDFRFGQEGKVDYNNDDFTYFFLEQHLDLPDYNNDMKTNELFPYFDKIGRTDLNIFFHKRLKYYQEDEYRIVWHCKFKHDIFIKCPGAIRFAKK